MYCHCGKSFKAGRIAPGPIGWTEKQVQYCETCGRMSHVVQEKEPEKFGPIGCRSIQNVLGHADGTASLFWWIKGRPGVKIETLEYTPYPFTKVNGMDQGRNHLIRFWQALDTCIDSIRGTSGHPLGSEEIEQEKVRAKTYAEVLAQLMAPFYEDTNAVLAESMNRWKARQAGEEHQTPGLGEALWHPTHRFDGPIPESNRNVGAIAKPAVKFDEQKTVFIKHCLENGSQTPEALAAMFECTVGDIKAVLDQVSP